MEGISYGPPMYNSGTVKGQEGRVNIEGIPCETESEDREGMLGQEEKTQSNTNNTKANTDRHDC